MLTETKSKIIFLAEDDEDDATIFRETLADLDPTISLVVVENGILLLKLLNDHVSPRPDLIFLDMNMPLKNGLQCLKEIKSVDKWKSLKTIMLSTSSHPEQIEESYHNGAALYLTKPNSYSEFKAALAKCVRYDSDELKMEFL